MALVYVVSLCADDNLEGGVLSPGVSGTPRFQVDTGMSSSWIVTVGLWGLVSSFSVVRPRVRLARREPLAGS